MLTLYPDSRLKGFAKVTKLRYTGGDKIQRETFLCWSGLLKVSILRDSNFVDISTIYRGQEQSLYPSLRMPVRRGVVIRLECAWRLNISYVESRLDPNRGRLGTSILLTRA